MQQRRLLPLAIILVSILQTTVSAGNLLTVQGDRFYLNGRLYDMWGRQTL
ncbi:MAG: hypothetical protein ACYS7Y_05165 [Planctomycetota bacterium]|jgi:hypothetical protein